MTTDDNARARLVARAWDLAEQGHSVRYVAEQLGLPPSTAHRYIREGRDAATWLDALDRAEERRRMAMRLDIMTDWLLAERTVTGGSALEYVPVLLKLEDRRARLLGTDAPTRVAVSDDRPPAQVDPATVAAVRAVTEASEREVRELAAGPPTSGEDPTP